MERVTIERYEDAYEDMEYGVYDSDGILIEDGFITESEAIVWANENGYNTDKN